MGTVSALLDETHDPQLRAWVASANVPGTDFPVQNLPFGRFYKPEEAGSHTTGPWRIGVAIGDQILDLSLAATLLGGGRLLAPAWANLAAGDINTYMETAPAIRRAVRVALSRALRVGSPLEASLQPCLVPMGDVVMGVAVIIKSLTDSDPLTSYDFVTASEKAFISGFSIADRPPSPYNLWASSMIMRVFRRGSTRAGRGESGRLRCYGR